MIDKNVVKFFENKFLFNHDIDEQEFIRKERKQLSDFSEDDYLQNQYIETNVNVLDPELFKTISFYVPIDKIRGDRDGNWEHNAIYDVNKKEYYQNFPPVAVKFQEDGTFEFSDGFHRVNFCIQENLPVPCMVSKRRKGTHTHTRSLSSTTFQYVVKDENCEEDLANGGTIKCEKGKYPLYDKERERNYKKVKNLLNNGKLLLSLKEKKKK